MVYDAVIVGAGPAGLFAAMALGRGGWRVCVVDQRMRIGLPVRCGEATGNRGELARFVDIDDDWIARDLSGLSVRIGMGPELTRRVPDMGVVLHRERFEQSLADAARRFGTRIRLGSRVSGLSRGRDERYRVELAGGERLEGGVVIGADGPRSSIGRWAGICEPLSLAQAFSAAQYRIRDSRYDDDVLRFVVGRDEIPHGYLWVFPKGGGEVSVGAGLYGGRFGGHAARYYLEQYLEKHFSSAKRSMLVSGCAPLALMPRRLHRCNVAVVGDAARQVNPLTAGGIMNALEATDELTRRLLALPAPDADCSQVLASYSAALRRGPRRQQQIFLLLQRILLETPDAELRSVVGAANRTLGGLTDRSRPFRWPLGAVLRIVFRVAPRAARHAGILLA